MYSPYGHALYPPFHRAQVQHPILPIWPSRNGLRIVKRQHLNHKGKHTEANARAFLNAKFGMLVAGQSTARMIQAAVDEMDQEKKHITAWATEHVSKMIIEAAQQYNWTCNQRPVNHIRDIGTALRQTDSNENFDKAYKCLFGIFEGNKNWASSLEAKYMEQDKLVYSDECDESKKGYVEKIITQAKVDKVKNINKSRGGVHNKRVGISRPASTITAKMKFRKKPAGEYFLTIPNVSTVPGGCHVTWWWLHGGSGSGN
jgi:hypothetical protein